MNRRRLILVLLVLAVLIIAAMILVLVVSNPSGSGPQTDRPAQQAATDLPQAQSGEGALGADASAQDVVRYFFAQWNAKNAAGMDECRVPADRGLYPYDDLAFIDTVTLTSLQESPREEALADFDASWAPGAADVALIEASFTIQYNEQGRATLMVDGAFQQGLRFFLVKEAANGPWRIAMQGY